MQLATPKRPLVMLHKHEGGTAVTNFPPSDYPRYVAALEKAGDEFLTIVSRPFGDCRIESDYSLHDTHPQGIRDLSHFWNVFPAHSTP